MQALIISSKSQESASGTVTLVGVTVHSKNLSIPEPQASF